MKVIGYARVSTDEQGASGLGLEAQAAKLRAYCELYGHELVEVVTEAASGKNLRRLGLQGALANIRAFDDFDSYGHLDYILRCGPSSADGSSPERSSSYLYEKYADVIDPILCELILREKALELNTSPLKKGFPETNPGKAILKKYHDFGGRLVTVGSDAHTPEGVGFAFDRAAALLKECGFTEYATFEKRQPVMHTL